MISRDLRELLLALNAHGVEYLIVGGYAVGVHSEPRATKDLDIFIRADEKNSEAVYRALAAFGAPVANLTPRDFKDDPESIFQVGMPPHRADLLQSIDGVAFEEVWSNRTEGGDRRGHTSTCHFARTPDQEQACKWAHTRSRGC